MTESRSIIFTSNFAKLEKHQSEKLNAEISNDRHPYMIDFPIDRRDFFFIALSWRWIIQNCAQLYVLGVMAKAACHCLGAHEQVIHGLCYL